MHVGAEGEVSILTRAEARVLLAKTLAEAQIFAVSILTRAEARVLLHDPAGLAASR